MIKYIITSDAFTGEATLTYDENGERPTLDCFNTNMREEQHRWMMRWVCEMAINQNALQSALRHCKLPNLKFRQIDFDPTFADFWAIYFKNRYKDNSSKKVAEKRWNGISKGAQLAAYNYVPQYFLQIPAGTQPKLAETYLGSEVWIR
ncbi:MAG: hypothetical protein LBI45_05345 [Bacteroidales bacterium]|jgi:hypothetical protein|nr:hypothetical protein [Bacteroidales bacterium]